MPRSSVTVNEYTSHVARLLRAPGLTDTDGLFLEAAAVAADMLQAKHAAILIPLGSHERQVVGCYGLPSMPRRKEPLYQGVIGKAFETGIPQLVPDVGLVPHYVVYDPQVKSELAVPIPDRSRRYVEMVINLESDAPGHFGQPDISVVCSFGVLVSELRQVLESRTSARDRDAILREILDQLPDEVLVIDRWFRPLYANRIKRQEFRRLADYLESHPLRLDARPEGPPPLEETCYFLIEHRTTRCELCVCNRAMNAQETVLGCYEPINLPFTVELSAAPIRINNEIIGCVETARKITQREGVLDHAPDLMKGVTENQALEEMTKFLHNTMHYDRVRLYSLDSADGSLTGLLYCGEHSKLNPETFKQRRIQMPESIRAYLVSGGKPGVVTLDGDLTGEESLGYWRAYLSRPSLREAVDREDVLELDKISETIAVPLEAGSQRWAIFVDCYIGKRFTHDDLQALSIFARVAGASLRVTHDNQVRFVMACLGQANVGLLHLFSNLTLGFDFDGNVYQPCIDVLTRMSAKLRSGDSAQVRCLLTVLSQLLEALSSTATLPISGEPAVTEWADRLWDRVRGQCDQALTRDIAAIGPRTDENLDDWATLLTAGPTLEWPGVLQLLTAIARGLQVQQSVSKECTQIAESVRKVLPRNEEATSKPEQTDLIQIINLALQTLRSRQEVKDGVELRWVVPPKPIHVKLRKYQFLMAILVLTDNALRAAHGDPKGFVAVDLEIDGLDVVIRISNNGHHIPVKYHGDIGVKPFSTRQGGGLGLVLAKAWIQDEGGSFGHSYNNERNVTTFTARGRWLVAESQGAVHD